MKFLIISIVLSIQLFAGTDDETVVEKLFYSNDIVNAVNIENITTKQGFYIKYFPNTTRYVIVQTSKGLRNGLSATFKSPGTLEMVQNFKNGKRHGESIYYNENGVKLMKFLYQNGKQIFPFFYYSEDAQDCIEISKQIFKYNGVKITEKKADKLLKTKFKHVFTEGAKFLDEDWILK